MRGLQRHLCAKEDPQDARYFVPQSGAEKIIINMVDSNHDMWDTLVRVSGPWKVEPDDERGAILIVWNMGSIPRGGASLTVDIKAKLRKLTAHRPRSTATEVGYGSQLSSCAPSTLPGVSAPSKNQPTTD